MTTKTISYYIAQGYTLSNLYNELIITSTGGVAGRGLQVNSSATIINAGNLQATNYDFAAVEMLNGGKIINRSTGTIVGFGGVDIENSLGTLFNYGIIEINNVYGLAVAILGGGCVTNGSNAVRSAKIVGGIKIASGADAVRNFATIVGSTSLSGGTITNGSVIDTAARLGAVTLYDAGTITNFGAIGGNITLFGAGSVTNFGTISGSVDILHNGVGVDGAVTNGSASVRTAACLAYVSAGTVTNFGTIDRGVEAGTLLRNGTSTDTLASCGSVFMGGSGPLTMINYGYAGHANLDGSGSVTNGSVAETSAVIDGLSWNIGLPGATTLSNFGTINGVTLEGGGQITNGSLSDLSARLIDRTGLNAGGSATVMNWGTIVGLSNLGFGAVVEGGVITNGSSNDKSALITDTAGYAEGVRLVGAEGFNFGTVAGGMATDGSGAFIYGGDFQGSQIAFLTNGAAGDATALITGRTGAILETQATLTNFGTIAGTGGVSVRMSAANERLVAESGSTFDGSVIGGGGTLELASGTGTISGLGATGRLSGAEAMTFSGFGAYLIDLGASWRLVGRDVIGAGANIGIDGALASAGATTASGTIAGTGSFEVAGGTAVINPGAVVTVAHWVAAGGSTEIEESLVFRNTFSESVGATVTLGAGDKLILAGSAELDGTVNGPGAMSLANATVDGLIVGGKAIVAVTGTVEQTGDITLGGTGAATLQIFKTGVWNLGSGDVLHGAGGGAVKDYGLLVKNTGSAVSTIGGPVFDDGTVEVATGTLDFAGKLFGTGILKIDSGTTMEADGSAIKTLTADFNGSHATLAMKFAKTFAATISGFAASDTLELLSAKATGASVNGSDQLVIVNGNTTVATLQLAGSYAGVTFTVGSNGHGGTDITIAEGPNEAPSNIQAPSPQLMAMAMAAMAPPPGVSRLVHGPAAVHTWMLTRPGTHLA